MDIRPYSHETDFDAVARIWREVGWIDGSDGQKEGLEAFCSVGRGSVALMDGEAECFVHWTPGDIAHTGTLLPFAGITAVTTSRIARKQGFATALTARALVEAMESGAAVAGLGIFDQGFYDRFGFGTTPYEHRYSFDPASLQVDVPYRPPVRLGPDDWEALHGALRSRMRAHGTLTLEPPQMVQAEMKWTESPFGLGYRDQGGTLTHFVYGKAKDEQGPYSIWHMAYRDGRQLLELFRLLRELGDQVASVVVMEPPEIQLQDLIEQPFRQRVRSIKSEHETLNRSAAFTQLRILDLAACVGAHRWPGPGVAFDLTLDDPLERLVPGAGIGGDYTVTVGGPSRIEPGHRGGLPVMEATVNAFSRFWFGVRPASSLAITDRFAAPPALLSDLDEAVRLPRPSFGWFI
ncbi:MAG TPA: GNAT family N-acetyltransferase [Thermoanaerobaculia bacterium]|nr:GNAT family N-acetyltransferase [Thermoanaerobaculia bacterium]